MEFPGYVSLTVTNACNLRCQMCAQWGAEGYVRQNVVDRRPVMTLADWKRVVDEAADHGLETLLVRGGEPFLMPGIRELLQHIADRGLFTSIDTNGTRLGEFAEDIVRIGRIHITISVDGPEQIHDQVRGVKGCYQQIATALRALREAEQRQRQAVSKSLTFTISPWSYHGLGAMPDVARDLGLETVCIVPYYYIPEQLGKAYERELDEEFGCRAYSWRGFHQERSGVDVPELLEQLRLYKARLGSLIDYPYLPLSEEEYRIWFEDPADPVFMRECPNVERLVDIQPTGDANYCIDFPDFSYGNVREATLSELWHTERALRFRERRQRQPFSACHRCGGKYVGLVRS